MAFSTDLKKYLPENQQRSDSMNEFLDAVGEALDGFKSAIDDFQKYNDFQLIPSSLVDTMGEQFDVQFPRNMSEDRKREYLNGIVTLYRSKGSERSLIRIFRLIGWEVEVDECFIVEPSYFQNPPNDYTIENEIGGSTVLTLYDTIFGTDIVYPNGKIYADLYDTSGNQYAKRQIYGEVYAYDDPIKFMKVPYIRIKVTSEDYDIFTSDYTENEKIYSYNTSEEFEILTLLRNYFLDRARPAHVAILEISTPFALSDTIVYTIGETLALTTENAGLKYDGTASYGKFNDRYILGETMGAYEYGTTAITTYEVDTDAPDEAIARTYAIGASGDQNHILIRKSSDIVITVPSDATVGIYATEDIGYDITEGTAFWQLIETVTNQVGYTVTLTNFFGVFVKITTPSSTAVITATINLY